MSSHPQSIPPHTPGPILEQLDRVLSSPVFSRSDRSSKLLRFVVEQTFAGQAARLKEYTLGVEALGKASSFDPRLDPSVRLEVSRLRTRLERYYATDGAADPIGIILAKGSYAPQFEQRRMTAASASVDEERLYRGRASGIFGIKPTGGIAALGAALAVVAVAALFYRIATPSSSQGVFAERAAALSPVTAVSVAVLPFVNLSGDAAQDFLSDGMTEEITSALAKIPDLKVVARTSAFQFKGLNRDVQSIGRQLHATHLIEGSVRKEGERIRIIAQLIDANSGVRLSNESEDRKVSDIFDAQEQIARRIAGAIMAPLSLAPGQNLVNNRSIEPDDYQQYLRANTLIKSRGGPRVAQAQILLEQVINRNPDYAPAWADLSEAYLLAPIYRKERNGNPTEFRHVVNELLSKAQAAAQRAVQLDPNLPEAYKGYLSLIRGQLLTAEDTYKQSLALDPNNVATLQGYSLLLATVGRVTEANAIKQQVQALEPFVPILKRTAGLWLWVEGQNDAAIAILKDSRSAGDLAMVYASIGRYEEAADLLENSPDLPGENSPSQTAASLLRTALRQSSPDQSLPDLGYNDWVYLHIGAPERAIEGLERDIEAGFAGSIQLPLVWHASFASVRKTERFRAFARNLGLVDYWRARGWPKWCHPTTRDDFECE